MVKHFGPMFQRYDEYIKPSFCQFVLAQKAHPSHKKGWRVRFWVQNPLGACVNLLKKKKKKLFSHFFLNYMLVI